MKPIYLLFFGILISSCTSTIEKPKSEVVYEEVGLKNPKTKVEFSNQKDKWIQQESGIEIFIPNNSFVDLNGNPISGNVEVNIKDVVKVSEILSENISTSTSDGRILDTRGMVYIDATFNGEEVQLADESGIDFFFPTGLQDEDSPSLFYGIENEEGVVEWEETTTSQDTSISYVIEDSIGIVFHRWTNIYFAEDSVFEYEHQFFEKMRKNINFSDKEKNEFLNRNIRIHWILFPDGDFEILQIDGNLPTYKKKEIEEKLNNIKWIKPIIIEKTKTEQKGNFDIKLVNIGRERRLMELSHKFRLTTKNLGWINCDFFIEMDVPKISMMVKSPDKNAIVKLIFKNYKSILTGGMEGQNFIFYNIPEGEEIQILVLKADEKEVGISLTDAVVQSEISKLNPIEIVKKEELRHRLENLN